MSVILYVICLIVIAIIPVGMTGPFVNNLQHSIDFNGMMTRNITLVGSFVGIVGWFVISAVTGYIFAIVYN